MHKIPGVKKDEKKEVTSGPFKNGNYWEWVMHVCIERGQILSVVIRTFP